MEISETNIVNAVLWGLAGFSLITWSVIFLKAYEAIVNSLRNRTFLNAFWSGPRHRVDERLACSKTQIARVYQSGLKAITLAGDDLFSEKHQAWQDLLERSFKQQIQKERSPLEAGLGWLASIGSVSPFVGLFGTVWGIMHALKDISSKGSASLEVVAGPIGEALVATAIGIGVAIPAVLAYNFFLRQNRKTLAELEHFANDFLHATIQDNLIKSSASSHGHTK